MENGAANHFPEWGRGSQALPLPVRAQAGGAHPGEGTDRERGGEGCRRGTHTHSRSANMSCHSVTLVKCGATKGMKTDPVSAFVQVMSRWRRIKITHKEIVTDCERGTNVARTLHPGSEAGQGLSPSLALLPRTPCLFPSPSPPTPRDNVYGAQQLGQHSPSPFPDPLFPVTTSG